jgi:hypothetical protein
MSSYPPRIEETKTLVLCRDIMTKQVARPTALRCRSGFSPPAHRAPEEMGSSVFDSCAGAAKRGQPLVFQATFWWRGLHATVARMDSVARENQCALAGQYSAAEGHSGTYL